MSLLAKIYKKAFISETEKSKIVNIDVQGKNVESFFDVIYGEDYKNNIFDMHFPTDKIGKFPTVFLIHGGGYVGGQKEDFNNFAKELLRRGFCVVNMEYTKSDGDEKKYMPTPIYEFFDLYDFIKTRSRFSEHIDFDNIFVAGSSAGGHIASLIGCLQSNPVLKENFNLPEGPKIKGLVLSCPVFGPYEFMGLPPKNTFHKIVYGENNPLAIFCNGLDNLSDTFPPTLLTSTSKDLIARVHTNLFCEKANDLNLSVRFCDVVEGHKLGHVSMTKYASKYPMVMSEVFDFLTDATENRFVKGVQTLKILETEMGDEGSKSDEKIISKD